MQEIYFAKIAPRFEISSEAFVQQRRHFLKTFSVSETLGAISCCVQQSQDLKIIQISLQASGNPPRPQWRNLPPPHCSLALSSFQPHMHDVLLIAAIVPPRSTFPTHCAGSPKALVVVVFSRRSFIRSRTFKTLKRISCVSRSFFRWRVLVKSFQRRKWIEIDQRWMICQHWLGKLLVRRVRAVRQQRTSAKVIDPSLNSRFLRREARKKSFSKKFRVDLHAKLIKDERLEHIFTELWAC